ncbi:MAG: ATP-binding protein [Candidatus Chromulinivorax sp.]|nr:ATP-binding protein [Candidatus Chromulinivorax sp.]
MERNFYLELIKNRFKTASVCAILGARQVGKTTIARQFAKLQNKRVEFFDLENAQHLKILENPLSTLEVFNDCIVVIDEIQLRPDLFPTIRVLVDDPDKKYQFLILGSASRDLIRQSSQTLAGRISYIELPPFSLFDFESNIIKEENIVHQLLIRGGFPRSYLANSDEESLTWRNDYITTFLERDLSSFGFNITPLLMRNLWMMLCFYHGQTFNAKEIAKSLMISDKTAKLYTEILGGTFMIRILQPWFENIRRRQVKSTKIYFRDTGIFNALTGIQNIYELSKNPKIGALWEGFALEQVINCLQIRSEDCYFWGTQDEAELDLLVFKNGKRYGFEFKYSDSPKITKSMGIALKDLKLEHLFVIFPGSMFFSMTENITGCGIKALHEIKI